MASQILWGAILVAAGSSRRFGQSDKLFALLGRRTVLENSLARLLVEPRIQSVVVVVSRANAARAEALLKNGCGSVDIAFCSGGETRSESVRAGLEKLPPQINFVIVHDAARPLVPLAVLQQLLNSAEATGAAAPVLPVTSTLLVESPSGRIEGHIRRDRVREVQTPQAAERSSLEAALAAFPDETDETSALFRLGVPVEVTPGHQRNLKITSPEDLLLAEAWLSIEPEQN